MIIDFHTHVYPDAIAKKTVAKLAGLAKIRAFTDGSKQDLLNKAKKSGVDLSLIVPVATAPHQLDHINESARAVNLQYGANGGLLSFAAAHPDDEDFSRRLEQCARDGFRGVKIHPVYQGVDLDDPRYIRIVRRCQALGLLVITHCGIDIGYPEARHCSPEKAASLIDACGSECLVLAHMGGWKEWDRASELLAGSGVYLDSSFSLGRIAAEPEDAYPDAEGALLTREAFVSMVDLFGDDHILFGTDSPWNDAAKSIEELRALPLSEAALARILGENARRLLRL